MNICITTAGVIHPQVFSDGFPAQYTGDRRAPHNLLPDSESVFNSLLPSSARQEKGETGDVSIEKDPDQVCLKESLSWLHSLQAHTPAFPFWLIGWQSSPTRSSHLTRKFPQ